MKKQDLLKFVKRDKIDFEDEFEERNYIAEWYIDIENRVTEQCKKEIENIAKNNNFGFNLEDYLSEFFVETFMNLQLSTPNELGKAMEEWLKERSANNDNGQTLFYGE